MQLWGGWRSAARTVACCSLEAFLVLRCADGVRAPAATQPRDAFACAVWLLRVCMKAKTTCKRTREVKKKTLVFPPTTSGTTLGMGEECTFRVEDGNLSDVHAVIGLHEDGQVYLKALGRTYFLIGVRLRAHTSLAPAAAHRVRAVHACGERRPGQLVHGAASTREGSSREGRRVQSAGD